MASDPLQPDAPGEKNAAPLFVDLDGTLTRVDTLHESLCGVLVSRPGAFFQVLGALQGGKARFKETVASLWTPDVRTLPYNEPFLEYLREEKARGRAIYLATAANRRIAEQVAEHLKLFDGVIASDGANNLSGARKLAAILAVANSEPFCYAGNGSVDLNIWKSSAFAVVVNASGSVQKRARQASRVEKLFPRPSAGFRTYLRAARTYQWVKNLLLLLPVLPALAQMNLLRWRGIALGGIAFCLCSSAFYVFNDLLDIRSDRLHARKRKRPFAAGELSVTQGAALMAALLIAGLIIAGAISLQFLAIVLLYLAVTATYSLGAKRIVLVDVLILAGLYTVRVYAGAIAADLPLSFWILAFSMSLFLSLAFVKRYAELQSLSQAGQEWAAGRGYRSSDLHLVQMFGVSSGLVSVLILGFYIDQHAAQLAFKHPIILGLLCPLLLYWIFRIWLHAHRGIMHDDPVVFAIRDKISRFLLVLGGAILAIAAF